MRLGIDFGTTRIIAAAADRGNFPLVPFESGEGSFDWFPSLISIRGDERRFGWQAWLVQSNPTWTTVRSIKRFLEDAGPHTKVDVGDQQILLTELLGGMVSALRDAIVSYAGVAEPLEIMLGVPANANSNQRFLTADAFRSAGFTVLGLLNEPSAASIEFGHKQQDKASAKVLVYDLGGGTFDASLVELSGVSHTVRGTAGIATLGGDNFDHVLARMAIGQERLDTLEPALLFRLEEECRRQKEALHPNSRRIVVDLEVVAEGLGSATIPVAEYYAQCRPLLDQTLTATTKLATQADIDVLYVTGGGSELPLVARVLREEFGRKVKRSEYTRSATAIGLAIQADATTGYRLREVFTRNFGVWREKNSGRTLYFDAIFPAGTRLPAAGEPPLRVRRVYSPVHNVGHFRFLEASAINADGQPDGDIALWDDILFPFAPFLKDNEQLETVYVSYSDAASMQDIEESYECDSTGAVTVTIRSLTAGYERVYKLGRWSDKASVLKPGKKRSKKATS